jgi:hypothetical protein
MTRRRRSALLLALCVVGAAASAGATADGRLDIRSLEGVYKFHFKNGTVQGDSYVSEDVPEIVGVARDAAYVRTHLDFYNGHICAISGVARVEGPDLVYRTPAHDAEGKPAECALHISRGKGVISLADDFSCRDYCGARGMFGGTKFPAASRRPIRYMARLKASPQFKEAMAAYGKSAH